MVTKRWQCSCGTGLAMGGYTCTITDANLCTTTQSVSITEPTAISAVTSQTNVSCNGGSDGTATVNASGGTGSLNYVWSPSGGNAAAATGLAMGGYTCTITDANLCIATQSVSISQPAAIASSQSPAICSGQSITVGTNTYNSNGTYIDVLTAANGCDSTVTTNLTVNPLPNITATAGATTICNGSGTTLTAGGADTYMWTGGPSASTYSVSPTTTTTYTVTGTNSVTSCSNKATVTITVNPIPTINISGHDSIASGSVDTLVAGGATSYACEYRSHKRLNKSISCHTIHLHSYRNNSRM